MCSARSTGGVLRENRRPEISNTIGNYLGGLMQDCRWLTLTLGEVLAFLL
jgi:hypothetical protein